LSSLREIAHGKERETAWCYPDGWRVLKSWLETSLVQRLVDVARK